MNRSASFTPDPADDAGREYLADFASWIKRESLLGVSFGRIRAGAAAVTVRFYPDKAKESDRVQDELIPSRVERDIEMHDAGRIYTARLTATLMSVMPPQRTLPFHEATYSIEVQE